MVALEQHHPEEAEGHQHQRGAEYGIAFADDFIDGENRGENVVGEYYPHPCADADAAHQGREQLGGAEQEHRADQHHQHNREPPHGGAHGGAEIQTENLGERLAIGTENHHAREVIVHCAEKNSTECNPQERHRAEACAEYGTENRSSAGDVEQLNQENTPPRHFDVVDAVGHALARRGTRGVCPGLALEIFSIGKIGSNQCRETQQKRYHCRINKSKDTPAGPSGCCECVLM